MSVSAIEADVRRIWTEALGSPPETVDTDFFEAGGQSLGLIRFLAAVQDAYGIELPIHELFADGFTVASATAAIDRMLTSAPGHDDSDALVAELEQLSDEEIRALLAQDS
jgi:acyl carrier protein